MDKHLFDRWAVALAHRRNRRVVTGGLLGAVLAGTIGTKTSTASTARLMQNDGDCSLGCESSICGQIPGGCTLFPSDNIWNTPVDTLPVEANSDAYVKSMGLETGLHPDFGAGLYEGSPLGIPFVRVPANQPLVEMTFDVAEESDPGPYPIPLDVPIEGGSCGTGDRHVIVVQEETCLLYELYDASQQPDGSWRAFGGARFDLTANDLRTAEWTSADAAGMAILPGLVRYEEIAAGVIPHALRFTASVTREEYVWPARHQAGASTDVDVSPMGQRFRLKSGFDMSAFSPVNQIILQALKTYGMFLADNG
ncbi:MAG: hypothetical protein ACRDHN_09305, partial [Thermomicrobiales bacterium]